MQCTFGAWIQIVEVAWTLSGKGGFNEKTKGRETLKQVMRSILMNQVSSCSMLYLELKAEFAAKNTEFKTHSVANI